MRLAHLSDPHFSYVTKDLSQFCSKRWLGNLNLALFRQHYKTDHLDHIPELLEKLGVEAACITGDFASTSLPEEFAQGRDFVAQFPMPTFVVPGNHDCYTKESEKAHRFYEFFPHSEMKTKRMAKTALGKGWWVITLDCALATAIWRSNGKFREDMDHDLIQLLQEVPKEDCVVIVNHFPLIPGGSARHDLARAHQLQLILRKFPQVKLYLHGHDHTSYIKHEVGLPLVVNAGSCARQKKGEFVLFDLTPTDCHLQRFRFHEGAWVSTFEHHYAF